MKSPVNPFDCHVLGFHAAFPVLSIPMAQGQKNPPEPWGENRLPFVTLGVTGNWERTPFNIFG